MTSGSKNSAFNPAEYSPAHFHTTLRESFDMPFAVLNLDTASVFFEHRKMAEAVRLRVSALLETFNPSVVRGRDVLDFLNGRLRIQGEVSSVPFLNYYLRHGSAPDVHGGGNRCGGYGGSSRPGFNRKADFL